jgi:hypothetical protein
MPPNSVRLKLKKHPVTFKQIGGEKILKRRRGKKGECKIKGKKMENGKLRFK